jgi:hypothetical protein
MIERCVTFLEQLGGVRPVALRGATRSVILGLWWVALLLVTLVFAGRYSKFVYVDF